ncbi:MAG: response regulator [Lachnospiraceae bacterium]|nr:response regulator [Lachnospiraceae bacterium]
MYNTVLIIQCIAILAVLTESWIVLSNWRSKLHSYLFLNCVATLINSIGYLFELVSKTEEAYYISLMTSWIGRVWISFGLLLFCFEICAVKIPVMIRVIMGFFNIITFAVILTTKQTGLFYTYTSFGMDGNFPEFQYGNGPWHYVWGISLILYIILTFYVMIRTIVNEKHPFKKKQLKMVLLAVIVESVFMAVNMFGILPITDVYDVTMLGFPLGAVIMLIAIIRYNLLDVESLAREYAIDELSAGVIAVDDNGRVTYYNKMAERIFPSLKEDAAGVLRVVREAISGNDPLHIGDRLYTPEEKILEQDNGNGGILYALTDSTGHYRHIREMDEQRKIADKANEAKSKFLASISHEIRTPINAVLGMDEMILRESREKDTLAYAMDIKNSGRTLLALINDILDLSKIEEGRMEILPTEYGFVSVINDLVNMIRDRAEKKGLKFEIKADPKIPFILFGDEIRIKQILLNLLTNSVKYTEEGLIVLEAGLRETTVEEAVISFKVSDTGIGMKPEDMDKLFVPYERIEELRNRNVEGTGLGMSIVQQLLALMDSHLEVNSVYGEGSDFYFEIRQKVIDPSPIGDITERLKEDIGCRGAERELFHAPDADILVIDDTEVNLKVVKSLLKRTRIRVETANSGRDGLILARRKPFDVVLIDSMMPDMNGVETLQRMKEEALSDKTVYIAFTADAVTGARESYLKEGFRDFLTKPVDAEQLEEMLREYLPTEKLVDPSEDTGDVAGSSKLDPEIYRIDELHVKLGLELCDSEEVYKVVLNEFLEASSENIEKISGYCESGDIENYTIRVHGLKSSAGLIGATRLSGMAKVLEHAGQKNDIETIRRGTERLIAHYRALCEKLAAIDLN